MINKEVFGPLFRSRWFHI